MKRTSPSTEMIFFFCDEQAGSIRWHQASTFDLDIRVMQCALKIKDQPLLAELSAGDFTAQEVKYHVRCLVSLYNKARDKKPSNEVDNDRKPRYSSDATVYGSLFFRLFTGCQIRYWDVEEFFAHESQACFLPSIGLWQPGVAA